MIKNSMEKVKMFVARLVEGLNPQAAKIMTIVIYVVMAVLSLGAIYVIFRNISWFILGGIVFGIVMLIRHHKKKKNK